MIKKRSNSFHRKIERTLRKHCFQADASINIRSYTTLVETLIFLSIMGTVVTLFMFNENPILLSLSLALIFAPLIVAFMIPLLLVRKRVSECEKELPFVAEFLAMASAVGISPTYAFSRLKYFNSLKRFAREARIVEKIRALYALSPIDALIFYGKNHPSKSVRNYITSVAAIERSGGEVYNVLYEKASSLLSSLESRISRLPDQFSFITSIEIIAFILVPISLIGIGATFSSQGVELLIASCITIPILMTAGIVFLIEASLPKELEDKENYSFLMISFIIVFPTSLLLLMMNMPAYVSLTVGVLAGFLPSSIIYYSKEVRRNSMIIGLASLARDIAEETKKGKSPTQALRYVALNNVYPQPLQELIKRVSVYPALGFSLKQVVVVEKMPWIVKVFFELLDEAEDMGADPKTLDCLASFFERISFSIRSMLRYASSYRLTSIICAIIMIISVSYTVNTVIMLLSRMHDLANFYTFSLAPLIFPTMSQAKIIKDASYLSASINSILLGLLEGKARGGSIVNGLIDAVFFAILSMLLIWISDSMCLSMIKTFM